MIRIHHLIAILSLLPFPAGLLAQDQDEKAGKILDQFVRETQQSSGFEADFHFTVRDIKEETESSFEGSFFMKGEQYCVRSDQMELYFDGETLWNYLPDVKEVNVTTPEDMDESTSYFDNPTRFFRIYKEDFFYSYVGEDVRDSRPVNIVDLYPKLLDKPFSRIRLAIEKTTLKLSSTQIYGKDGVHYILHINSMTAKPLDDHLFRFDPSQYPGVEIIDLR